MAPLPIWATSAAACFCEPLAPVDDCMPSLCEAYLIVFFVLHTIFFLVVSIEVFLECKAWRLSRSRARPFLILVLWFLGFSRSLRFLLILARVGEDDGTSGFLNSLILVSGILLLSAFSVVVYLWAQVYKMMYRRTARSPSFLKERAVLLTYNAAAWFFLIIFHILHIYARIDVFGIVFNITMGILLLIVTLGYMIWGGRVLFQAKSVLRQSNSLVGQVTPSEESRSALKRLTAWVILACILATLYVMTMLLFRGITIFGLDTTFSVVLRHSIYRSFELLGALGLLITFRQHKATRQSMGRDGLAASASVGMAQM